MQHAVIVDVLKNICGISWFSNYRDYAELNLRKFQEQHCAADRTDTKSVSTTPGGGLPSAASSSTVDVIDGGDSAGTVALSAAAAEVQTDDNAELSVISSDAMA